MKNWRALCSRLMLMCDTCKLDRSQSLTPTPVLGMLNRLGVFSYFDTAASYLDSKLYRPRPWLRFASLCMSSDVSMKRSAVAAGGHRSSSQMWCSKNFWEDSTCQWEENCLVPPEKTSLGKAVRKQNHCVVSYIGHSHGCQSKLLLNATWILFTISPEAKMIDFYLLTRNFSWRKHTWCWKLN